jgi:hypothetical protein
VHSSLDEEVVLLQVRSAYQPISRFFLIVETVQGDHLINFFFQGVFFILMESYRRIFNFEVKNYVLNKLLNAFVLSVWMKDNLKRFLAFFKLLYCLISKVRVLEHPHGETDPLVELSR